jgi:cysteinyl-tRNA synthetase
MGELTPAPPLREVRIYNTLEAKVVPLRPLAPPRVYMYSCGITPYKPSHIGHARFAVIYDVVARFLRYLGYHVFYIQNITDIEDKVLKTATEEGVDWRVVIERNLRLYLSQMRELGCTSVNMYPRCTDFIPEIIDQIEMIIKNGHAYAVEGDVYFDVSSFPAFGKLSGQRLDKLEAGARVEVNDRKRHPEDFALWKGERIGPRWESPWGPGRPGWHIEDTAMTVNILGPRYDLHGGGAELKFPHHEAEIAQAESATGKSPLASIWMHNGLLNMHGEKMSKSLGNVLGIDEAFRLVPPMALRFYYLSAHYRTPQDYLGPESLYEAKRSFDTLQSSYSRLMDFAEGRLKKDLPKLWKAPDGSVNDVQTVKDWVEAAFDALPRDPKASSADGAEEAMVAALCEDFQVREAVAALFGWANEVGTVISKPSAELTETEVLRLFRPFVFAERVLGLSFQTPASSATATIAPLVELALKARTLARSKGDYAESDRIRKELSEAGIVVEDSASGPKWRLKK